MTDREASLKKDLKLMAESLDMFIDIAYKAECIMREAAEYANHNDCNGLAGEICQKGLEIFTKPVYDTRDLINK